MACSNVWSHFIDFLGRLFVDRWLAGGLRVSSRAERARRRRGHVVRPAAGRRDQHQHQSASVVVLGAGGASHTAPTCHTTRWVGAVAASDFFRDFWLCDSERKHRAFLGATFRSVCVTDRITYGRSGFLYVPFIILRNSRLSTQIVLS